MQVRNLTALEMLNFLREQLAEISSTPTPWFDNWMRPGIRGVFLFIGLHESN
jgi:hypothetical protein